MNKVTLVVKILKAEKDLLRYYFDKRPRYALLLVSLYQSQKVFAQGFEHNTDM